ncbi:hypothetical protein HK101_004029 [Irineochytrium annulatum]|nr:hypothetical protein HK101_004029 [Irineochytrium annulatum]
MNCLITGASAGFGSAIARIFAKNGHYVILAARRRDRVEQLLIEIGGETKGVALEMDVSDEESVRKGLESLPEERRKIDVLVNNAGLALGTEPAHRADLEEWLTMIRTNCEGLVRMTNKVLPGMVERGKGTVINIGSTAGFYPYPGGNVYGATKAFVDQFTLNLRADLVGTGVRATNIAPGMCSGTEFSTVRYRGDQGAADKVYQGTQSITPDDIADTVYWVATRPAHLNINTVEMMPTCQGFGGFNISRK